MRRIIKVVVLAFLCFGVHQVVWAPAEERRYAPGTVTGNLAIEGNTTLGDAVGDSVTFNAGTLTFPNITTVNIDAAMTIDATGQTLQMKGEYDFSLATLIAADATAAGHVVTRNFGDARYPRSAAANLFSNWNLFRFAGLPITVENTTDAAGVEILKLFHNRGNGKGIDGDYMDLLAQFSDDTTSSIPFFLRFKADDLDSAGGTFGGFSLWAGSTSPIEIFRADGANNVIYGNIFSIDMAGGLKTGISGSGSILQFLINNSPVVQYGTTQYTFATGRDMRVEDNITLGDKLAVGATIGEVPVSSMTFVKSTDKGAMPVPRMTTAQRTAIGSPVAGVQVDDSDLNALTRYNGTTWDIFKRNINLMFSGDTTGMFSTASTNYVQVAIFYFAGTDAIGTPTAFKAIGFKDATPTSWDIQVVDLTNALTIATKTGNTGTAAEIVDMGTLSNLPTGPAMFEVQLKRTGGTGGSEVHAHALSMLF